MYKLLIFVLFILSIFIPAFHRYIYYKNEHPIEFITEIKYYGTSLGLYYGLQVGCLINKDALAFRYNKTQRARPIIGCAAIINGLPKLLPMVLNKHGRWIKKIIT